MIETPDNLPSRQSRMDYFRAMVETHDTRLTDEEKEELASWESENLGTGEKATSDWPGWEKYIGPPPWKYEIN